MEREALLDVAMLNFGTGAHFRGHKRGTTSGCAMLAEFSGALDCNGGSRPFVTLKHPPIPAAWAAMPCRGAVQDGVFKSNNGSDLTRLVDTKRTHSDVPDAVATIKTAGSDLTLIEMRT